MTIKLLNNKNNNLRIVELNNPKKETPIVKKTYHKYLEEMAKKRGLIVKGGRMVNPYTKKISDGNLCEESILGRCKINKFEMVPVPSSNLNNIVREKAKKEIFEFVKKHQPDNNKSALASQIRSFIQKEIEPIAKKYHQNIERVDFYTAVGSPLDYQYGIDGWIEIKNNKGHIKKITFDLKTGNSQKAAYNQQADVLLNVDVDNRKIKSLPKETLTQMFNFRDKISAVYEDKLKY